MNILLINPGRKDYIINYFLKLTKKFKANLFLIDPDKNIASFAVSKKLKIMLVLKLKQKIINYF